MGYYNVDGTPREGRDPDVITMEQAAYMGQEFDENIYLTCVDYFGTPFYHNGSDAIFGAGGLDTGIIPLLMVKSAILLSNVRDSYYDPGIPYLLQVSTGDIGMNLILIAM